MNGSTLRTHHQLHAPLAYSFSDDVWHRLSDQTAGVFSFSPERAEAMKKNRVLKLVAALPYLAGCENPERTALSHMAVFVLAASPQAKAAFSHSFQDSVHPRIRLERISHFDGGDERIISRGMDLLCLAMINDHISDASADEAAGKLNPVTAGHWDAEKIQRELFASVSETPCPEMDTIMGPEEVATFWEP